jgi:ABC-type antimicrobial peptide transport system permease subunit
LEPTRSRRCRSEALVGDSLVADQEEGLVLPVVDTRNAERAAQAEAGPVGVAVDALLAAIEVERSILNLLLFMIVGVAGFSILAIFTMIVSEKYRDIGILKSLGVPPKRTRFAVSGLKISSSVSILS